MNSNHDFELGTVARFCDWNAKQKQDFLEKENELIEQLLLVVPDNLRLWAQQAGPTVIHNVLSSGYASIIFHFGASDWSACFSGSDLSEIVTHFQGLATTWQNEILVEIQKNELTVFIEFRVNQ